MSCAGSPTDVGGADSEQQGRADLDRGATGDGVGGEETGECQSDPRYQGSNIIAMMQF